MKICIVGYSGSGKSTLARILGEKYGLPVLHLDATFWYGEWQSRGKEEQTAIVRAFMDENPEGWVIDGNYTKICPERFAQSDAVYFLNYNRFSCYRSAKKRYKQYRGTVRPDCPCEEKFDFGFAMWILFTGRTRKHKANLSAHISECNGAIYAFKNRKQLNEHLQKL